jgi:hypothetical protein
VIRIVEPFRLDRVGLARGAQLLAEEGVRGAVEMAVRT